MADNICPYLGSVDDPLSCSTGACEDNLCYASGEGEEVSNSTQKRICLGGRLSSCSRFPSEPTLAVLSETAVASSSVEDERFDVVEEQDSVPIGDLAAFDSPDEEEYEIAEEQDPDEAVFQGIAPVAEREDLPEDIHFDALDADPEHEFAAAVADDFYFDELDQVDSTGEPEHRPADVTVVRPQVNPTIGMAPVAASDPGTSRQVAQETLAGEELSSEDGVAPDPLPDQQASPFFQPVPTTTEGSGVDVQDTAPVRAEASSSDYDPTVVLPVVAAALGTPGTDLPATTSSEKGLPEPAVSSSSEGTGSPNGVRSQKERAGVDPNWLARHAAAQAARGHGDRTNLNANHKVSAGAMPEVVLRPAPIQGAARPTARPVSPLTPLQDQPTAPAKSGRPKAFLYLSLSTVLIALLLLIGGSFLVYDSLQANEEGLGVSLLSSPTESAVSLTSPATDTKEAQPTLQATPVPTEEPDSMVPLPVTREQHTTEPTPVAATATASVTVVAMAVVTDTATPIPTATPEIEDTLTALPSPTTKATVSPTPTAKPTETKTATSTATATETTAPTASLTATKKPTATATATKTPSPTETATATSTVEPTQTATSTPMATATEPPTATSEATETPQPTATATEEPSSAGMSAAEGQSGDEASQLYTIAEGDTLYGVALEHGITLDTLLQMNPGLESQFLSIGQQIWVPNVEPTSTPEPTATETLMPTNTVPAVTPVATVTIQEGDNLYEISEQYGVSVDLLLQANPGLQPQQLQIGQEILIPSQDATIAPTPTLTTTSTRTPEGPLIYVVKSGDILSTVAEELGVTVDEIIASNPDVDPRRMSVGQELNIPSPNNEAGDEPEASVGTTITPETGPPAPDRIVAPSIGLDAEVVAIDSHKETQGSVEVTVWDEPDDAAGFHRESSRPGEGGNAIISGLHNDRGEVFRDLAELEEGSVITVYTGGQAYLYEVDQTLIVPHEGVSEAKLQQNESWLEDTSEERLTLISYWPYEDNTHWVVIVAEP